MISGLDSVVERKLDALKYEAGASAEGLSNRGQPLTEQTELDASFDRTASASIHEQFSRDALSNQYAQLRTQKDSGTMAEVIAVRTQHEFLAELERSFQVRCRSRVSSVALAASLRQFFGQSDGIFEMIRKDLGQPLKRGGAPA